MTATVMVFNTDKQEYEEIQVPEAPLPCPFCGRPAKVQTYNGGFGVIGCGGENFKVPRDDNGNWMWDACPMKPHSFGFPTARDAIAKWNKRRSAEDYERDLEGAREKGYADR